MLIISGGAFAERRQRPWRFAAEKISFRLPRYASMPAFFTPFDAPPLSRRDVARAAR